MNDVKICQSCGMSLDGDETKGTNKDGSLSDEYCVYCFADGAFTRIVTMEEMIESNLEYLDHWLEETGQNMTVDEARAQLMQYLPTLNRWKK
ncbi:zinc ribbon domain-containing protein [Bacteroidales bacterium OttesenSCG-928-L03]|nr:zinc ribbon domain-containing protein [Bacteroidales bacterium OttesenSCG-928-L03]